MKDSGAQADFAQIASRINHDPRSLALLREAMADIDRKKERGKRLRQLREERDWSRPKLMEKAGLGAGNFRKLNYWEEGTFDTDDENWEALAEALGVSFQWLYNGDERLPPPADILKRLDRIDAQRKRLRQVEKKLDQVLEILAPDAAVQAAADAAQPKPEADPRSVPGRPSSVKKAASAKRRVAQR